VVVVVARLLAPLIATTELSQDLASEVALRTHEMEAQRSFAAQIIDSLPVGLYVIDRSYRIRAWNRKREAGTQGVSREEAIGEDITEWHEAQQRLAETEKLAAVGQLAAGVMHEINNPLATILACCEALALRSETLVAPQRHAYDEYLKIIDTEVQRCRRIVESLLDFSRPKAGEKKPVDVNAVVEHTLFLLKHHARFKRVEVVRELTPGLPAVRAD